MQTLTLPFGINPAFNFFPAMRVTVLRRKYERTIAETNTSVQSGSELYSFLQSAGYSCSRAEAESDFQKYVIRTYVVEIR